jgi:hypothetical protein
MRPGRLWFRPDVSGSREGVEPSTRNCHCPVIGFGGVPLAQQLPAVERAALGKEKRKVWHAKCKEVLGGRNPSRRRKQIMRPLSKLVGALVVGFVGVANAEQVTVYEAPFEASDQPISADFAVNRKLGRAWVDVEVQSRVNGSEAQFDPPLQRQLDGLYYDSARKQVLYRTATGPIVCAEDATTLGETYLKSTGNCGLISSTEQRSVDDGFDVHKQTVAKVVFEAQTSTSHQHAAAARK